MNDKLQTEIEPVRRTNMFNESIDNRFLKVRKSTESNNKVESKIYKLQSLIKERFGESKLANNWAVNALMTASKVTLNLNNDRKLSP